MIGQQFPDSLTKNRSTWKSNEFWPDNIQLKNTRTQGKKLFLICNPLFGDSMYDMYKTVSDNTYKILLYTDIHLQLRMAYDKQAYWFTSISRQMFNAPCNNKKYLRRIINSSLDYRDIRVDPVFLDVVERFSPDQLIRLEDFINSTTINNFAPPNRDQLEFLKYWSSLQSPKATRLIEKYYRNPFILC